MGTEIKPVQTVIGYNKFFKIGELNSPLDVKIKRFFYEEGVMIGMLTYIICKQKFSIGEIEFFSNIELEMKKRKISSQDIINYDVAIKNEHQEFSNNIKKGINGLMKLIKRKEKIQTNVRSSNASGSRIHHITTSPSTTPWDITRFTN